MLSLWPKGASLLFLLWMSLPCFAEDWPMLGRGATRNSVSREKNPPTWWQVPGENEEGVKLPARNIKWQAQLGNRTKCDPVIANGLVWVGTGVVLMCFREKDGQFLYQYVTQLPKDGPLSEFRGEANHSSSPLIEGDYMWFTTPRGETVCLDVGPLQRGAGMPREVWKVDMHQDLGVLPSMPGPCFGNSKTCSPAVYKDYVFVLTGNRGEDDHAPATTPRT